MIRAVTSALSLLLAAGALAYGSPDKPPAVPFCDGSSPGLCNPVDPSIVAPIPPEVPPAVKLRAQLAKERRDHAKQMAACKGLR